MLLGLLMKVGIGIINFILSIFGGIPNFDTSVLQPFYDYLDIIVENGAALLSFFLPLDTANILLPFALVLIAFEPIYTLVMWILKKIPFLNIE